MPPSSAATAQPRSCPLGARSRQGVSTVGMELADDSYRIFADRNASDSGFSMYEFVLYFCIACPRRSVRGQLESPARSSELFSVLVE